MPRIVADLGNSRLKWGRVGADGRLAEAVALPLDDPGAWEAALRRWEGGPPGHDGGGAWAVASVNPPVAERLTAFLGGRGAGPASVRWFRSAADVPMRHALTRPETAGADRALGVAAAAARGATPALVVLCGTAVTVERVAADGTWQGGAIAAGLGLAARALHQFTAQLPQVAPRAAPPPWGDATIPALEAGVFWGVVGAVRELLTRQAEGLGPGRPAVVWTGGDAPALADAVAWPGAVVVPDLVLHGLAAVAFGAGGAG